MTYNTTSIQTTTQFFLSFQPSSFDEATKPLQNFLSSSTTFRVTFEQKLVGIVGFLFQFLPSLVWMHLCLFSVDKFLVLGVPKFFLKSSKSVRRGLICDEKNTRV